VECIIFTGLPASGKSTFYKERFFNTHVRINLDMLRTRGREEILLQACIKARQPFVVDNTNVTREFRARYISLAKVARFRVAAYYFTASVQECLARNREREGKARVPDQAIWRFSKELQLPSYAEGFDKLYYVKVSTEGDFIVEAWKDEV
jgi:predicted kinase